MCTYVAVATVMAKFEIYQIINIFVISIFHYSLSITISVTKSLLKPSGCYNNIFLAIIISCICVIVCTHCVKLHVCRVSEDSR